MDTLPSTFQLHLIAADEFIRHGHMRAAIRCLENAMRAANVAKDRRRVGAVMRALNHARRCPQRQYGPQIGAAQ